MPNDQPEYLLWLDFETPGLTDTSPIEVAAVLTRADDFTQIAGYESLLDTDSAPWTWEAIEMHAASGLLNDWVLARRGNGLEKVLRAQHRIADLLESAGVFTATLAGSGVGTFDLPIIKREMPRLAGMLTYHVHDVGVMRRAYRRAVGADPAPRTEPAHRAMADVQQSLTEGRAFAALFQGIDTPIRHEESNA